MLGGHAVHAAHGRGGKVADQLNIDHDVDDGERKACCDIELDIEREQLGEGEPSCLGDSRGVDHAERNGNQHTDNDSEENGSQLDCSSSKVGKTENYRESNEADDPVLNATEPRGALSARHIPDSRGIQAHADGEDHRTGHERRKQELDL